jgi:PAS domain-containing protein
MPAQYGRDPSAGGSSRDSSLGPSETEHQQSGRKNNKNLDRRRESSRYAARDRRGKEADIFMDLKDVAPIVDESTVTHVDRIALLRVASTMCRMRRNAGKFLETDLPAEDPLVNVFTEQNLVECLDGFVLLADSDGTILYVSESVSLFLGLTQTDLVGRFLNEFVHTNDYDELVRLSTTDCSVEEASTLDDFGRYLVVRMKTVISPRGRTLNLKSALYKAILCRFRAVTTEYGRLSLLYGSSTPAGQGNSLMLANSAVKGAEATSGVYMTRHTCDMKFSYVSDSLNFLLRHDSRSLMGTSFYDLIHPSDVASVAQAFRELFKKSHCRTPFYRLLGANGSVAWTQTEATTVNHTARGQKGQYVLCTHSVIGMQSEAESWAEPIVEPVGAANPAICASRIKREIIDMAGQFEKFASSNSSFLDYMGRQPEFIECVDFTPLIDPVSDVNFNDFNPARPLNGRGRGRAANNDADQAPSAKQKRKKSFEDVLSWLVRDEADSPPPAFTDPNFVGSSSEDMFLDSSADPSLALFNQSFRGGELAAQQRELQQQPFVGNYARDFRSSQNAYPAAQQQQWSGSQPAANPAAATPMARRAAPGGRAVGPVCGRVGAGHRPGPVGSEDVDELAGRKGLFEGGASHHFSRFDEYAQRQHAGGPSAATAGQRPAATRTLSALSANDGYALSSANQSNAGRPVQSNSSRGAAAVYAPMRDSRAPTAFRNASRASSAAETDDESGVQFMGKFANGGARSRSSSSTASVKNYGNSAARRYSAQNSPAPATRRPVGGRAEKPREQWSVNVNQLNAVPTQQLLQQTQYQQFQSHYNGSPTQTTPNFYYSARNTSNPSNNNYGQTRPMDNYLDPFNGVPSKRMAYGDAEPIGLDCQALDKELKCDDLSRLAPYVPEQDIQLEDLDLESFYPGLDLSEFFQSELPANPPPQMNKASPVGTDLYGRPLNAASQIQQYPANMMGATNMLSEDWSFGQY